VICDISVDSDALLVTDFFVDLKIKSDQFFGCDHDDRLYICVSIWMSARTCMNV
jgi:hypothetical protein